MSHYGISAIHWNANLADIDQVQLHKVVERAARWRSGTANPLGAQSLLAPALATTRPPTGRRFKFDLARQDGLAGPCASPTGKRGTALSSFVRPMFATEQTEFGPHSNYPRYLHRNRREPEFGNAFDVASETEETNAAMLNRPCRFESNRAICCVSARANG